MFVGSRRWALILLKYPRAKRMFAFTSENILCEYSSIQIQSICAGIWTIVAMCLEAGAANLIAKGVAIESTGLIR